MHYSQLGLMLSHTLLSCYPLTIRSESRDDRGYKPTIRERQSPLLSKIHLGLKGEDTHSRVGNMVKKKLTIKVYIQLTLVALTKCASDCQL